MLVDILATAGLFLVFLGYGRFKSLSTVIKFTLALVLAPGFTFLGFMLNFGQNYQF